MKNNILLQKEVTKVDTYRFRINNMSGLKLNNGSDQYINITFQNEQLLSVDTSQITDQFKDTEDYWKLMQAINEKIQSILSGYKNHAVEAR